MAKSTADGRALIAAAATPLEITVAKLAAARGTECLPFIREVLTNGCVYGVVSELIYHDDTTAFFRRHRADITVLLVTVMQDVGCKSPADLFASKWSADDPLCLADENQNLLAWFAVEETLRDLTARALPDFFCALGFPDLV